MDSDLTILPPKKCRRKQSRRMADRATEDLYKTFSSSHCLSCLELLNDAVLLLDEERKFFYATSQMHSIINRSELFTLTPRFTLLASNNNPLIEDFFNGNKNQINPLVLQLADKKNSTSLSLIFFRLPAPSESDLHVAKFLIKIRDLDQLSTQQWSCFTEQFSLTPAEARLCRALADGFTLKDYSLNNEASIHTLRSHLKSIFNKTYTRRQIDLLRLLNLFMQRHKVNCFHPFG